MFLKKIFRTINYILCLNKLWENFTSKIIIYSSTPKQYAIYSQNQKLIMTKFTPNIEILKINVPECRLELQGVDDTSDHED